MTLLPDTKVTTEVLWRGAFYFALVDVILVVVLAWRIRLETFRQLKWVLVATAAIFWCLLWALLGSYMFWESVYHYFFPAWARWYIPWTYGLLFGGVALLFWWLALRLPSRGVVSYCILGGLWGMTTHIWAVHRGILDKPPILQGVSPLAAVIMPIFEFVFYWCVILSIAWLVRSIGRRKMS